MTLETICYSVGFSLLGVFNIWAWLELHELQRQNIDLHTYTHTRLMDINKGLQPLEWWRLSQ